MPTTTDALRQIRDELAALVPFPAVKGWQPNGVECWMEALGSKNPADAECLQRAYDAARAALAAEEKGESDVRKLLARLDGFAAFGQDGSDKQAQSGLTNIRARIKSYLAKHAAREG